MEYVNKGDLLEAVTSMMSDLSKHPETAKSAGGRFSDARITRLPASAVRRQRRRRPIHQGLQLNVCTHRLQRMTDRLPAQAWPAVSYIAEELEARGIKLESFLDVIDMPRTRWDALMRGEMGLLLKESQAIAGALGLSMEFVSNLNIYYMRWKRAQR